MAITNTYLTNPGVFRTAGHGESCGNGELFIEFVGGPYRVQGLNDQQVTQLKDHFAEACTSKPRSGTEVVEIHVCQAPPESFQMPDPPPLYRSFELEAHKNQISVAGENMFGLINLSGTISGRIWTVKYEKYFHSNTFENFFRMLVTYRLMDSGGMLLHSAGIVNREEAFLFPGRSEDGKSTLSRLSVNEGRTVLSDDMNAVTWHNGRPFVEKVPFTGDFKRSWTRSSSYPLKAIFSIRKAEKTSVEDLSASRTLTLLTSCTPYINADPHRMPRLLENLYQLTQKTPSHTLRFSRSGNIWPIIEKSLAGQRETIKISS